MDARDEEKEEMAHLMENGEADLEHQISEKEDKMPAWASL